MSYAALTRSRPTSARIGSGGGVGTGRAGRSMWPGADPVAFNRGYEAGQLSIRDPDLPTSAIGVNAAAERGRLDVVISRCRYLFRNNELVRSGVEMRVARVVGKRIGWEPNTGVRSVDDKLRDRRDYWVARADPQRKRSLTQICATAFRERLVAGEFGRHLSWASAFRGYAAGPAVELWAFERMPMTLSGRVASQNNDGNWVRQGIEFDADRRAVAFWVLVDHPSDEGAYGLLSPATFRSYGVGGLLREDDPGVRRLPVGTADLCYVEHESGQLRGAPPMAAVMRTIRAEDGYFDNVMLLSQLLASLGVFFEVADPRVFEQGLKAGNGVLPLVDTNGNPITRITGSTIGIVPKDTNIKTASMQGVQAPQFTEMARHTLRRASRSFVLPFGTYSGDSSQDNFSSRRADEIDCRDVDQVEQWFLYESIVDPYRVATIQADLLSGALKLEPAELAALNKLGMDKLFVADASFDGFSYVNPSQEAAADALQVETGLRSEIQIIQEHGGDWRSVVDQRLAYEQYERERRAELGLPERVAVEPAPDDDKDDKDNKDDVDEDERPGDRKKERGGRGARASAGSDAGGGRTDAARRAPLAVRSDLLNLCLSMGTEGAST